MIRKYSLFLIAFSVFIITALVNVHVRQYGDDFFYARFMSGDLPYFFTRHLEHYFVANGRVIVHLLVTFFLGIPTYFWMFINSVMLAGMVYFGARIAVYEDKTLGLYSAIILGIAIMLLDPEITRQSVYWLTGSFNYVYPMFLLLVYWFLIRRMLKTQRMRGYLPAFAFLSAATVEQASLMTFGLTLLTLIEIKWMQKRKLGKLLLGTLLVAAIGMLTVIAAPGVFHRASVEDSPRNDLFQLIEHNIYTQGSTFVFSEMMAPYLLFALLSAVGIIMKGSKRLLVKWSTMGLALTWLYLMTSDPMMKWNENQILLAYFLLVFVLGYAALLALKEGNSVPMVALVLCFGSQFMMLVSPVYGPRNLVFAIVMLSLYTATLLPRLNAKGISILAACGVGFLFDVTWFIPIALLGLIFLLFGRYANKSFYVNTGIILGYTILLAIAITVFIPTVEGYASNAQVFDRNMKLAQAYKAEHQSGELIQYKLPHEQYAWVMPYHNSYYHPYYNLYLGLKQRTKVMWK
ncbi:DUF6056 family protein [Ammoniphilus sp. YIM 78166]|uniref:DUF6056 family protein n=1 Tax=Ammoniphilus sp. YIM 78166 TaxID=1644106 RepID=UPI00106F2C8F|nr:DUF6056 family protein [Ammoniphilus sp. YIM 78166]